MTKVSANLLAVRVAPAVTKRARIEAARRGIRLGKFVELALRAELRHGRMLAPQRGA